MKGFLDPLWNLLFPIECLECGRDAYWLCDACQKKLEYSEQYFLKDASLKYLDGVFIILKYNSLAAKLIKTFKYGGAADIGSKLGEIAALFLKNNRIDLEKDVLLSVPLSPFKKRWRGFNQSEVIAKILAAELNRPLATGLMRTKNRPPQAKLKREGRLKNLKNCFAWTGGQLEGQDFFLIDDVMTTGTTLEECARVLKEAGAGRVRALVLAHG